MKNETESALFWQNSIVKSISVTALPTSFAIPSHHVSAESLLPHRLIEETTSSQSGSMQLSQVNRATLIRSIRGKYSFVRTSSNEFAERKRMEISLEG